MLIREAGARISTSGDGAQPAQRSLQGPTCYWKAQPSREAGFSWWFGVFSVYIFCLSVEKPHGKVFRRSRIRRGEFGL